MKPWKFLLALTLPLFMLTALRCKKPVVIVDPPIEDGIVLDFHPMFDGQEIEFSKMQYTKPNGEVLSITNWGMILAHLSLIKEDSSLVQLGDGYQYIGFTVGKTKYTYADAPAGKYIGIQFQLGPDQAINHADPTQWPATHPLNANYTGLHWGWAGGYIFQALDGQFKDNAAASQIKNLSFHTASDAMVRTFIMPLSFTIEPGKRKTARIEFWADEYFKDPNEIHLKTTPISHTEGSAEVAIMNKIMENAQSGVYRIKEVK